MNYRAKWSRSPFGLLILSGAYFSAANSNLEAQLIYWTETELQTVRSSCTTGLNTKTLADFSAGTPHGIALDVLNGHLYWIRTNLYRSNLDGTNQVILPVGAFNAWFLAIESSQNVMFIADTFNRRILRLDLPDYQATTIHNTDLVGPVGIAVDTGAMKIYWTDQSLGRIERSNYDGSQRELILGNLIVPFGLALDTLRAKVYWSESAVFGSPHAIKRCNTDGSNLETVILFNTQVRPKSVAVDANEGKLYWTESYTGRIQRSNLDGSLMETVIHAPGTSQFLGPFGLALDLRSCGGPDCQPNGSPDGCDVCNGTSDDCDLNDVPDECQPDCNMNDVADPCDIASGFSQDTDGDGRPNECDPVNDDCEDPLPVYEGTTLINGYGATSDGPYLDVSCSVICDPLPCYLADIWHEYRPPCAGLLEIVYDDKYMVHKEANCSALPFPSVICSFGGPATIQVRRGDVYKFQLDRGGSFLQLVQASTLVCYCDDIQGDYDGSGGIKLDDVARLIDCMVLPESLVCPRCFDSNSNGWIDLQDVAQIQNNFDG